MTDVQADQLAEALAPRAELDQLHRQYADERAARDLDVLVERYRPLARSMASRFTRSPADLDDLCQVAYLGLVKALQRFEPDRGFSFTTYAWSTILGEMKRWYRDRNWGVRPPRRIQERYLVVARVVDDLTQELARPPTLVEVAARVGCDESDVVQAMEAWRARSVASFDAPGPDGRTESDPGEPDRVDLIDTRMDVERLLARLPARERRIVELRFFEGLSQAAIAKEVGLSQMHVSRLLAASLERLRSAVGSPS